MAELNIALPDCLHRRDGEVRLAGHRISLYHVASRLRAGLTVAAICDEFPTITPGQVPGVREFYAAHRRPVDDYLDAYSAELDALFAANPQRITTDVLKARVAAKQRDDIRGRRPKRTGTDG